MSTTTLRPIAIALAATLTLFATLRPAHAQPAKAKYPAMAPINQYLIPNQNAEIALARTAAPPSISGAATIMVLDRTGYHTAVKGANGFVCVVERAWDSNLGAPEFWNPKNRSPDCFNAAAARSYLPIVLLRAKLLLAGKSTAQMAQATKAAFASGQLPPLAPGAMSYMMSKQQYLNDEAHNWHPHLMFFVSGDSAATWGANLPGSPVLASSDSLDHLTIMMVVVHHWSDGTPAP